MYSITTYPGEIMIVDPYGINFEGFPSSFLMLSIVFIILPDLMLCIHIKMATNTTNSLILQFTSLRVHIAHIQRK